MTNPEAQLKEVTRIVVEHEGIVPGFRVWQLTAYDGKQVIVSVKEDMGNNWTKANAFIIALAQLKYKLTRPQRKKIALDLNLNNITYCLNTNTIKSMAADAAVEAAAGACVGSAAGPVGAAMGAAAAVVGKALAKEVLSVLGKAAYEKITPAQRDRASLEILTVAEVEEYNKPLLVKATEEAFRDTPLAGIYSGLIAPQIAGPAYVAESIMGWVYPRAPAADN